mgnify:CR=1 FL=1
MLSSRKESSKFLKTREAEWKKSKKLEFGHPILSQISKLKTAFQQNQVAEYGL